MVAKQIRKVYNFLLKKGSKNCESTANEKFIMYLLQQEIQPLYELRFIRTFHLNNSTMMTADLYVNGTISLCSFFDEEIDNYCTELALFLREETGRNHFFDLVDGKFTMFI